MSECTEDIKYYMSLTDDVIQRILESPDPRLEEVHAVVYHQLMLICSLQSKKLLVRIQKRDLYKLIGQFSCVNEEDEVSNFEFNLTYI